MLHLDDMALFVEVVKAKSFRGAATSLGMPNSTLSRRIGMLERAIGLRLFHRTTRRVEITEAGQAYFDRCERIVADARLAHEHLGDLRTELTGVLRITLPVDFATAYLAPIIADFSRAHPDLRFELDLTPRNIDLVAEPFDIAIRMRPPPDSHLIARPLIELRPRLFASLGYLAGVSKPTHPSDLAEHRCIHFPKTAVWHLRRGDEKVSVAIDGCIRSNNPGMARRLATLDQGIVLLPEELVAEDLDAGRLLRLLPEWEGEPAPVYVLTESRLVPAKTQAFIAFLRGRMR